MRSDTAIYAAWTELGCVGHSVLLWERKPPCGEWHNRGHAEDGASYRPWPGAMANSHIPAQNSEEAKNSQLKLGLPAIVKTEIG